MLVALPFVGSLYGQDGFQHEGVAASNLTVMLLLLMTLAHCTIHPISAVCHAS